MVIAKTGEALWLLAKSFSSRQVVKTYLCLVTGRLTPEAGVVQQDVDGRPAESSYRLVRYSGDRSVVQVMPVTGRNHQIRRHMKVRNMRCTTLLYMHIFLMI